MIRDRQRQDKKTEVLIGGELQSEKRIRKETARFGRFDAQTVSTSRHFFRTAMLNAD